jgi:hypothetical protein
VCVCVLARVCSCVLGVRVRLCVAVHAYKFLHITALKSYYRQLVVVMQIPITHGP